MCIYHNRQKIVSLILYLWIMLAIIYPKCIHLQAIQPHPSSPSVNVLWSEKLCFWSKPKKHQSPLPKILISLMKISESGEKYARINHLYKYVGGFSRERKNTNCFLQICSVLLHKMLTECWSGVDYWDVFISCLDSHYDGTHSLQSIHWWTSDGMLHFSKSVPMGSRWVNLHFWLNHSNKPICSTKLACYRCDH